MRLKRLELQGFKSFASRTIFSFEDGITAIVGPNGSGKSNIADAVRWVMGEQSYSSMRAKTTEDMIFAGTRTRAKLGMAEVILVFDNTTGWLPLEYSEVSVGRRAYRSGENEYLLNGARVRYRDLLDLFGGAGLARSNYTVISQGMVDAALSLRPEARRALFEEAAGVTPQLRKREETIQRIAEAERNLQRVADIIHELEPRVRSLQRQAERAQEQAILRRDLTELQRIWYAYQWQNLSSRLARAEVLLEECAQAVVTLQGRAERLEDARRNVAAELQAAVQAHSHLTEQRTTLNDRIVSLRRDSLLASERIKLYTQQLQGAEQDIRMAESRLRVVLDEAELAERELLDEQSALELSRNALVEARQAQAHSETLRRDLSQRVGRAQNALNRVVTALAAIEAQLTQSKQHLLELERDASGGAARLNGLKEETSALRAQCSQLESTLQAQLAQQTEARTRQQVLEADLVQHQQSLADLAQAQRQAASQVEALQSRYELQQRLRQEMPGYHPGVRSVLSASSGLKGLLGTVASLMQVLARYEEAIEAAAGPRLQHVVAQRWADAEAAIAHLKKSGVGWATFMPLDTLRARPALQVTPEAGVHGTASSLVRYDAALQPVYEMVLGSVVVVDDLPTARRLLHRWPNASLLVTLAGETVQPNGVLSGGTRRSSSTLLAQERAWRELPAQLDAARAGEAKAQAALTEALEAQKLAQTRITEVAEQIAGQQQAIDEQRAALSQAEHHLRQREADLDWQSERRTRDLSELDKLHREIERLADELAQQKSQQEAVQTELQQASQEAVSFDESPRQQLAALETRTAILERTLESQRTLLASHRASQEQLQAQQQAKRMQVKELESAIAAQQAAHRQLEASLAETAQQQSELRAQLEPLSEHRTALESELRNTERAQLTLQSEQGEARLELDRVRQTLEQYQRELAALQNELEGDLHITLPANSAPQQMHLDLKVGQATLPPLSALPAGLEDQLRSLKATIRRQGDVNPEAPAEYAETNARFTFMRTQEDDLRSAIASLREVIVELDALVEHEMLATFKQVRQWFSTYFNMLFSGGSASLYLTDPEHPSDSGVDISARPPGKRTTSLSMLSGGERSLTAVALIFSLLQAHPVPFCFLDEVDAALDEANIFRFRDLLRSHASDTQFIIITHNRRTIEIAQTIYGIAMGEQGISQVVSLKVDG